MGKNAHGSFIWKVIGPFYNASKEMGSHISESFSLNLANIPANGQGIRLNMTEISLTRTKIPEEIIRKSLTRYTAKDLA